MSDHQTSDTFNLANARVPVFQWISVIGMIVSLVFALSSRLTMGDRTAVDLAKLQNDVTEMRKQMAMRDDVSDLTKQMRDLEIQVAKLSDRLERQMKNEAAKLLNWIVYRSAPFIAVSLAIYAIWFCHTALMPFMQLRRVIAIEDRLQGALFQTESIQRGFLLTHDETELGLYEKSKGNLRALVTLLDEQLKNKAEKRTGGDIEAVVELKIVEMDQTIAQGKTGDFGEAIKIVKTNVGRRYSQQICDDLLVIRGLESSSTYQR